MVLLLFLLQVRKFTERNAGTIGAVDTENQLAKITV